MSSLKRYFFWDKRQTEQFILSEKLLDLRYDVGLSFDETAEVLNLSPEDYIDYEYGLDNIPVEEYYRCIKILEKLIKEWLKSTGMDINNIEKKGAD